MKVRLLEPLKTVSRLYCVWLKRPTQHDPVAKVVLLVAQCLADRVREILHIRGGHTLPRVRFTHPHGNGALHPMYARLVFLWHRTEASDHETAEVVRRHVCQTARLVNTPMLNGEIGHREQLARLLLNLPRQAVRRNRNSYARLIASDPAPPQPLSYGGCGPATGEKVRNDITLFR